MGTSQKRIVLADSTTYLVSRTYTLTEDEMSVRPHTNMISMTHTNGSHSQFRLTPKPNARVKSEEETDLNQQMHAISEHGSHRAQSRGAPERA